MRRSQCVHVCAFAGLSTCWILASWVTQPVSGLCTCAQVCLCTLLLWPGLAYAGVWQEPILGLCMRYRVVEQTLALGLAGHMFEIWQAGFKADARHENACQAGVAMDSGMMLSPDVPNFQVYYI